MRQRLDQPFEIDAVQPPRLLGETEALTPQHAQAGMRGTQLRSQEFEAPVYRLPFIALPRRHLGGQPHFERDQSELKLFKAARIGLGRRAYFGRAVISVDIAVVALPDLQLQPDIIARDLVEVTDGRRPAGRHAAGEQGAGEKQGAKARKLRKLALTQREKNPAKGMIEV